MDVLELGPPSEFALLDVAAQVRQPRYERVDLVAGENPGPAEAPDVGDGAVEIVESQLPVDVDRAAEGGDPLVRLVAVIAEPAAPESHPASRNVSRDRTGPLTTSHGRQHELRPKSCRGLAASS